MSKLIKMVSFPFRIEDLRSESYYFGLNDIIKDKKK